MPATSSRLRSDRVALWQGALAASLVSSVSNAAIFLGGYITNVFAAFRLHQGADLQLTIGAVILVSAVAGFAGVFVFGLFGRAGRAGLKRFLWLSTAILILSFAAPFAVPGTTLAQAILMNVMHVATAGAVLGVALRLAEQQQT